MDKNTKIQDMFKLAESLNKSKSTKIAVEQIETVPDSTSLPSEYITADGIMVSTNEMMSNTNFLSKLNLNNDSYSKMTFTKDEAVRIQNAMGRLTTGVIGVTPLTCLGPKCAFANTCIAQGTEILTYSSKNGYKNIENLIEGDIIYSFNLKTQKVEHDVVQKLMYMGVKLTYKITTHTGLVLKCTDDHQILTLVNDKVCFKTLKSGSIDVGSKIYIADTDGTMDDLIDSYGDLLVDIIEDIEVFEKEEVYDISVKNNHNFFANNICVHNCELQLMNKAPIGKDCWIEVNQIKYWMEKYIVEFQVDGSSLTDLHMIAKLCEYDTLEMRATKYLKENDQTLLTDFISSYDEQGNPISNKAVSAAFELKERIDRMRSKTLKELMATREAKAKIVDQTNTKSNISTLSTIKEQLDEMIRNKGKLVDSTAREIK